MFEILLCIFTFLSCSLLGYFIALNYSQRETDLKEFLQGMISLESEMQYRRDTIQVCLYRLSQNKENTATLFFSELQQRLSDSKENNFFKSWCLAVDNAYKNRSLTEQDIKIIKDIGLDLGKSDLQSQGRLFSRQYQLLEAQIEQAQENCKTKGKMYRSLGISVGLVIVIILI
ncbi:stage III sporulation protein AB [Clostridium aminobutyricum]|uniref:Stage III sporulation protein AB n=1 Tax=Clostridium aminobutyricum TaxID=33953 RepID=A0A939D894_CLOAM|nr:stage III sporulation protein AB [Clostridium aminobutyricum]MBN7772533.1 stage III sporulation protein AB [Clostridium aminobutyricum]